MADEFGFLAANWVPPWGDHLLAPSGWHGPIQYITSLNGAGETVGAIPVATQTRARLRFLSLAGPYIPYRGFPVRANMADVVAQDVASLLTTTSGWSGFRFGPVAEWDPVTSNLIAALKKRGWRVVSTPDGSRQMITLPNTVEEYFDKLSSGELKSIRRRERKMCREQRVSVQFHTANDRTDWSQVVHDLSRVESNSWLPREDGDLRFSGNANQAFWTTVFDVPHEGLQPKVWIVYFGDTPVAFDFNFDSGLHRYSIAAHYAESVRQYRLGFLSMRMEIENAIQNGIRFIDLGVGDPGYKGLWHSTRCGQVLDVMAFPPDVQGAALSTAFHGLRAAQSFSGFLKGLRSPK